jgi:prolyl-tRNA synthetase
MRPAKKYYDWEIKGVPLRLEIGPRDIANGTAFAALRTGGKKPLEITDIVNNVKAELDTISKELRLRADAFHQSVVQQFPEISQDSNGEWAIQGDIDDLAVFEIPFAGNDAEAEIIERLTGLTFLGDDVEPFSDEKTCIITGQSTKRRVFLARTY